MTLVVVGTFALSGPLARLTWLGYMGLTALLLRIPGGGYLRPASTCCWASPAAWC